MILFFKNKFIFLKFCGKCLGLFVILLLLLIGSRGAYASFEPGKWPCAYLARGSSGIAVGHLQNGFLVNPALLNLKAANQISLFYRNYYTISDLNDLSLSAEFSFYKIPVGFTFSQFGDKNYREQTMSIAAAWSPVKNLSLGAAAQMFLLNVKRYGKSSAFGTILSLHYQIMPKFSLAAVAGNLNEPKLSDRRGAVPVYFLTGFEFLPVDNLSLSLDIFKDNQFDFDFRYGLGYRLISSIEILLGFRQQVHAVTAGIQINKLMVHFGYALEMHPDLGISNAIEVAYVF